MHNRVAGIVALGRNGSGPMRDLMADSRILEAGDLRACFLPAHGMLCASLRHRGNELLRRVDTLGEDAASGHVAGIPITHPWANRLSRWGYRAAGKDVVLDPGSPLLHQDWNGTVIHGVPWPHLRFYPTTASGERLSARLEWTDVALLAVFPFPHTLQMDAVLDPAGLTISMTLIAHADGVVPVSFGFHPYLGLPELPRQQWRLLLPAMQRMQLDDRLLPTGKRIDFPAMDAPLATMAFDDGFALGTEHTEFSIVGGGMRIGMQFLHGYDHAQIYAPADQDLIALEPMTAPTNALVTGQGLRLLPPGQRFEAAFRVVVEA
jgi:aldose 1-epimerase